MITEATHAAADFGAANDLVDEAAASASTGQTSGSSAWCWRRAR
jgi:hypothetical protein